MGCKWCGSGLGEACSGPLGLDDLEVDCDCSCHQCPDCHSAHCVKVGGDEPCNDADSEDLSEEDYDR